MRHEVDTTGWHPYNVRKKPDEDRDVILKENWHSDPRREEYIIFKVLNKTSGTVLTPEGWYAEWKKWKNAGICWAYLDELVIKN